MKIALPAQIVHNWDIYTTDEHKHDHIQYVDLLADNNNKYNFFLYQMIDWPENTNSVISRRNFLINYIHFTCHVKMLITSDTIPWKSHFTLKTRWIPLDLCKQQICKKILKFAIKCAFHILIFLDCSKHMKTIQNKFTLQLHMDQADLLLEQAPCFQLVAGVMLLQHHSVRWKLGWAETSATKLDCRAGAFKTTLITTRAYACRNFKGRCKRTLTSSSLQHNRNRFYHANHTHISIHSCNDRHHKGLNIYEAERTVKCHICQ